MAGIFRESGMSRKARTFMDGKTNWEEHNVSRRKLLKVMGASAGMFALESASPSFPACSAPPPFIKGADISWLPQMEAQGYKFYNANGIQEDLLTILKGYGINAIKLRT